MIYHLRFEYARVRGSDFTAGCYKSVESVEELRKARMWALRLPV
jgi:hypothetical protein